MIFNYNLDIEREICLLKTNVLNVLSTNSCFYEMYDFANDSTFRSTNWLITFPYNFLSIELNNISKEQLIECVRKLAVINVLYGSFFLREDTVLDDYNISYDEYRKLLIRMCYSHILHKLAIGQLLKLCGIKIYSCIFNYEKKYYEALTWEKKIESLTPEELLLPENLKYLGWKICPLVISFAAFCTLFNIQEKIPICEELLIKYHIAHQLFDDIKDFEKDLTKPDYSCLIKTFMSVNGFNEVSKQKFKEWITNDKFIDEVIRVINDNLICAEKIAHELCFEFFEQQIKHLKSKLLITNE